jgi:hypothetical protein
MLQLVSARRRLVLVVSCGLALLLLVGWGLSARAAARSAARPRQAAGPPAGAAHRLDRQAPSARPGPGARAARFATPAALARPAWQPLAAPHGRAVLVYPPSPRALGTEHAAPVVTMLHGMCSDPVATCELGRAAATSVGWFVCPTGNAACGDAADWAGSGETKAAFLDQSLGALERSYGPFVARERGDVLIGFSRGAFVARDVARTVGSGSSCSARRPSPTRPA